MLVHYICFRILSMRYFKKSASIAALLLVLCACGQRGPLYLPETPPTETQPDNNTDSQSSSLANSRVVI